MGKMTIEEAKEIIARKSSMPFDGETFEKIEKAYDIAIKALEKQMPKKGIRSVASGMGKCPICGERVFRTYKCCPYCCQRLEWDLES